MKESLLSIFSALPNPPKEGAYIGARVKGFRWLRIAKNHAGLPAFFVKASIPKDKIPASRVSRANIEIVFNQDCEIVLENGAKERGQFVAISCLSDNSLLQSYFIGVISGIADRFGVAPSPKDILKGMKYLEELFAAKNQPPKRTILGLWGELFVIATSSNPAELVRTWHSDPMEKFDFSDGAERIEVKTCSGPTRKHHFGLEQVSPPSGATVIVVSIIALKATGGLSIPDLVGRITARISEDTDLLDKFSVVVAESIGNSSQELAAVRYDFQHARSSLKFFNSKDVPSVDDNIPPEVSGVHFESDLSTVKSTSRKALHLRGGIYSAL